ncbi:MAG: 4-hydroxy-tetrahydrodipicolinate synthase [Propionibacteriaceae bacterium]|nr:4-hydroxy-tetrahydrodipicolinate synthase [Propionibacteriaceae bacterium]
MDVERSLPFGRLATAMVTPFTADGAVDLVQAARLAQWLVDQQGNDAIIVNGTTGEAPTTSAAEKRALIETVKAAVGERARIVAGVGTFDTAHTVELAQQAATAGADGLLVVTPYYSRPPQDALVAHFQRVAEATDRPIMIYDIPHRSGVAMEPASLIELARHPLIVAVKDAKGQPVSSAQVMAQTGLAYYAGDDAMVLPLLAVGAVGVVGTSTHFSGAASKAMIESFLAGRLDQALALYRRLLPVYTGVFATQGVMLVKAGLAARGFPEWGLRAPLLPASPAQAARFVALLDAAGL